MLALAITNLSHSQFMDLKFGSFMKCWQSLAPLPADI
jgi:hypothetical protein